MSRLASSVQAGLRHPFWVGPLLIFAVPALIAVGRPLELLVRAGGEPTAARPPRLRPQRTCIPSGHWMNWPL